MTKQRKALKVIDKNLLPKGPKAKQLSTKKFESGDELLFESSIESWERQDMASSSTPKISNRGRSNKNVTTRGGGGVTDRRPPKQPNNNQKKRRSLGSSLLNKQPFAARNSKRHQRMVEKSSTNPRTPKRDFDRLKPLVRRLDDNQQQPRGRSESPLRNMIPTKGRQEVDTTKSRTRETNVQHNKNDADNSDDDMNCDSSDGSGLISTKGQEADNTTTSRMREINLQRNDNDVDDNSDDDMNCDSSDGSGLSLSSPPTSPSPSSPLSLSPISSSSSQAQSTKNSLPKQNIATKLSSERKNATAPPSHAERGNDSDTENLFSQPFASVFETHKTNANANKRNSKMTKENEKKDIEMFSSPMGDGRFIRKNTDKDVTTTNTTPLSNDSRKTGMSLNNEESDTPPGTVLTKLSSASSNNCRHKEEEEEDEDENENEDDEESIEAWSIDGHSSSPILFEIKGQKFAHPALPPGWKMRISESGQQPVYMHPDHGSTWHCPIKLTPNAVYVKTANGKLKKQSRMSEHITSKPESFTKDIQRRTTRQTPPSTRNPLNWQKEMKHSVFPLNSTKRLPEFCYENNTHLEATSYSLSPQDSTTKLLEETSKLSAQLIKNSSSNLKNVKKVRRSTQKLAQKGRPSDFQVDLNDQRRMTSWDGSESEAPSTAESEAPSTMSGLIRQYDKAKGRDYTNTQNRSNKTLYNKRLRETKEMIGMSSSKKLSPIIETPKHNDDDGEDGEEGGSSKMKTDRVGDDKNEYKNSAKRNDESKTSNRRSSFGTPFNDRNLNTLAMTQRKEDKSPSFDHSVKPLRSDKKSTSNTTRTKQLIQGERIEAWFTPKTRVGEVDMTVKDDRQNYEDVAILRFDAKRNKSSRLLLHSTDRSIQNETQMNHDTSGRRFHPNYSNSYKDKSIDVFVTVEDMERNDTVFSIRTPIKGDKGLELSKSATRSKGIPKEIHLKTPSCSSAEKANGSSSIKNSQRQTIHLSEGKSTSGKKAVPAKLASRETKDVQQSVEDFRSAIRRSEKRNKIQKGIQSHLTSLESPSSIFSHGLYCELNRETHGSVDKNELPSEGNGNLAHGSKMDDTVAIHSHGQKPSVRNITILDPGTDSLDEPNRFKEKELPASSHTEEVDTREEENMSCETNTRDLNIRRVVPTMDGTDSQMEFDVLDDNASEASEKFFQSSSDVRDEKIVENVVTVQEKQIPLNHSEGDSDHNGLSSMSKAPESPIEFCTLPDDISEEQISRNHSEDDSAHNGLSSTSKEAESPIEFSTLPDDVSVGSQSSPDSTKKYSADSKNNGTPRSIGTKPSTSITSPAEDCSFSSKGDSVRSGNDATSEAEAESPSVESPSVESDTFDDRASHCSSRIEDNDDATSRLSTRSFESTSLASQKLNQRRMSWRVLNPPHPICSLQHLDELMLDRKRKELKAKRSKAGTQTKARVVSVKKKKKAKTKSGGRRRLFK